MQTKTCTKCGIIKELSEFYKDKHSTDGYTNRCKSCRNITHREWQIKNKVIVNTKNKIWQTKNKDKYLKAIENWRNNNRDKIRKTNKDYYKNNKYNIIKQHKKYETTKLKNCISFRIEKNIRSRIRHAIKNQSGIKAYKTIELIGCTINNARKHIESQFTEGMSWKNYGEWHIDHIMPCSSFDLKNPEEQKKCFHYTNLQPLWAVDNLKKGDKIIT